MQIRKFLCLLALIFLFGNHVAQAGILVTQGNGITVTGADGVQFVQTSGITVTGADGVLNYQANGITVTGADGLPLTAANGITVTGADGSAYTSPNGITVTGADGITVTGADGITVTGADGIINLIGADQNTYQADSFQIIKPSGITVTGADGAVLNGTNGITVTGADGITVTGADGITVTGADGITVTGADGVVGIRHDGTTFSVPANPNSAISLIGTNSLISLSQANAIVMQGSDGITVTGADADEENPSVETGLQSVDPELALKLNEMTDDSSVNAVIAYHQLPGENDLNDLRQLGILGGTRFRQLPLLIVTARRDQLIAVSQLSPVRSIYGVRTLNLNSDPYLKTTQNYRVAGDSDLQTHNQNFPVTGRNITVAVLDTGVNAAHHDLTDKVVQNVRLTDAQSASAAFVYPAPVENLVNTDLTSGHGTFVAGLIAGTGAASGGQYNGVAPEAKILGLSAGDLNLTYVLSGFDYLLEKGSNYNVRAVNCSFSANTIYDPSDPVNIATKILTERGISVVFSAGNSGAGGNTLNPYAAAPWVISVGATDAGSKLAKFSSRGIFGSRQFSPSLVAPGVNVIGLRSTPGQTGALGVAGGADTERLTPQALPFYTTASGTSFSAPQVAGAVALMLDANPALQPSQIKNILQRTATPLPPFYQHEVGAGMLNAYAAVIEAAFPNRRVGLWRSLLDRGQIRFVTDAPVYFDGAVNFGGNFQKNVGFPDNAVDSTISIAWGGLLTTNDLGLKIYDPGNGLRGESNNLNLPGLTGRRETVTLTAPSAAANWQVKVAHTGQIGTRQSFVGAIQTTRVEYPALQDIANLSSDAQQAIKESLRTFEIPADKRFFRPSAVVSRGELAASLMRSGRVPQFLAKNRVYSDVRDLVTRTAVESVQKNIDGALFPDSQASDLFHPHNGATRLIAVIALVKAAGLQIEAEQATSLPLPIVDAALIPTAWRGYVAVALRENLIAADGLNFSPNKPLTRVDLARAVSTLNKMFRE